MVCTAHPSRCIGAYPLGVLNLTHWRSYSARHVLNVWRDAQCFNDCLRRGWDWAVRMSANSTCWLRSNAMSLGCTIGSQGVFASVIRHWPHTQLDRQLLGLSRFG